MGSDRNLTKSYNGVYMPSPMNIRFDFTNRHAVVTGGARGIGLQITRQFLEAGVAAIVCTPDTWAFPQLTLMSLLAHFPTIELTGTPKRQRSNLNNALKELPVTLITGSL